MYIIRHKWKDEVRSVNYRWGWVGSKEPDLEHGCDRVKRGLFVALIHTLSHSAVKKTIQRG